MKVRLRVGKITKVLTIDDGQQDLFSIEDVKKAAVNLLLGSLQEDFKLSLNKKDTLDDETKTLTDCGIVSGDLMYIITNDGDVSASASASSFSSDEKPGPSREDTASMNTEPSCSNHPDQIPPPEACNEPLTTADSGELQPDSMFSMEGAAADPMDCEPSEPIDMAMVNRCLNEPILCCEATEGRVPSMLRELYFAARPEDKVEAVCVVIHTLMLETGYIVHPEPVGGTWLPEVWKHPGFYRFVYTYPSCQDTTCSVTIVTVGTSLMVHGKLHGDNSDTRHCVIKPENFVHSFSPGRLVIVIKDEDVLEGLECCTSYYCLAKLSRMFKDAIAQPLVHDMRLAAGLDDIFGLLTLTQEIKLRILSSLNMRQLVRMSFVNAEFSSLCKDPYLWRRLYMKDYGNRRDNSLCQDWRKLYIHEYKRRKMQQKMMRVAVTEPPFRLPVNPSHLIPPWSGMIGGDYDLFPNGLPGEPGRFGHHPANLPRPRNDLLRPHPDLDPCPDPAMLPRMPFTPSRGGWRNMFGSFF